MVIVMDTGHDHANHADLPGDVRTSLAKDPVCGTDVDPATSEHRTDLDGRAHYFCSPRCKAKFEADPGAYLGAARQAHDHAAHAAHPAGAVGSGDRETAGVVVAEWTCPMHPEIRRSGPGTCPICGMALEPVTVTADSGPNPELADMTRRFKVASALSIPVLILGMGRDLLPALHDAVSAPVSNWAQLLLATPVVLWAGAPFFTRGWTSVRTMKLNMFTLIAMGTGVAWLFSVVATLAPGVFPASFRMDGAVPV
jgi:Cu+-exporting ATPase